MSEDYIISSILERMQPFLRHLVYTLVKAAADTHLSLDEAARQMGINRDTLKKRCQRGTFPFRKIGHVYYISKIDVNLYIKGGTDELQKYNKEYAKALKELKKNTQHGDI